MKILQLQQTIARVILHTSLVCAGLSLCGCDNGPSDTTSATPPTTDTDARHANKASTDAKTVSIANTKPLSPAEQRAHIASLQIAVTNVQAERNTALLKQTRAQAQVDAHQRDSQALLESLKNRAPTQSRDARTAEQFADRARMQLEEVLAKDQEYLLQLEQANSEVTELDSRLSELEEELHTSQSNLERTGDQPKPQVSIAGRPGS